MGCQALELSDVKLAQALTTINYDEKPFTKGQLKDAPQASKGLVQGHLENPRRHL